MNIRKIVLEIYIYVIFTIKLVNTVTVVYLVNFVTDSQLIIYKLLKTFAVLC